MTAVLDSVVATRVGATTANKGAPFPVATLTVAGRAVKKMVRTPSLMLAGTVSGVMFLLIFRYVFGGAIGHMGDMSYVDFVAPGFVVTSTLFSAMTAGAGVAEDLQTGLVDRLRSLPVRAASIIFGRVLADTSLATWGLFVTTAVSFGVGFRIHGGVGSALGAFGLAVLAALAFCSLFAALGFFAGSAQAAQSLSFLVFPLSFVSSAYVPVSTMPGWMQAFANHQPLTVMVDSARILTGGHAAVTAVGHGLGYYLPVSLAWAAGIIAVSLPLALWRLRRS